MLIRVSIITVSDTAFANPSADKSGPAIREIIARQGTCSLNDDQCLIVSDDTDKIRKVVEDLCASGTVDWLISTGGTGFGVRDVTPEAISPLLERLAPGLVHLMLSTSLKHTPLAALSRPIAGTIKNTLITTLPGSVKAVKENLEALFQAGVVDHAIDLIRGGSGKRVHTELAAAIDTTASGSGQNSHHHHGHPHGEHQVPKPRSTATLSHDPSAPVTTRHRKSPFPQISLENALRIIKANIQRLSVQTLPVGPKLGGHILAEDVYAFADVPPTPTTSVDGYALRSLDPPGIYNVLTTQTHEISSPIPEGSIYRINTGAPLPAGADTVIMVEDTELVSTFDDGISGVLEEKEIRTLVQVPPAENVRATGSDVRKGALVMRAGDRVTRGGGEVGTLTCVGRKEVEVYKKPVVAILSTGNEIINLHQNPPTTSHNGGWGGIYDTNRPSLQSALESFGYEVVDLGIVPDNISAHVNILKAGLQKADLVLTTGGTSMGPTDLLKPVIEQYLDGIVHFGRVSIKPGKPTTFASVPMMEGTEVIRKPIFALPGNPASALVTFYIFVLPALRMLGGWPEKMCELPKVVVQIQNTMSLDPRVEFHRVIIKSFIQTTSSPSEVESLITNGNGMVLKAYSTGGQRSSRVASLSKANGFVVLPALPPAGHKATEVARKTSLKTGEFAHAVLIGEIEME